METYKKSKSLIEQLNAGEEVKCSQCKEGVYKPFNPKFKINHAFVCDKCGNHINIDPVVDIE